MPMHHHPYPVLHLVLAGRVTSRSRRSAEELTVAQVEYLPAYVPHETQWRRGGVGFAVAFEAGVAAAWSAWGMLPEHPCTLPPGLVSGLLLAVRREGFTPDLAAGTGAEGFVAEALGELVRRTPPHPRREGRSLRMRAARALLLDAYASAPPLTELARQVEVHPVYLARAFREAFGETVGECVRRRRLDAACHRLTHSTDSLSEIAAGTGFADQSHLTRTFRRYLGTTPAGYRRALPLSSHRK
jgi:AraC family transcriptional regulator